MFQCQQLGRGQQISKLKKLIDCIFNRTTAFSVHLSINNGISFYNKITNINTVASPYICIEFYDLKTGSLSD